MIWLLLGTLAFGAIVVASHGFSQADPAVLARRARIAGGIVCLLVAVGLAVRGIWPLSGPLGLFGLSLLGLGPLAGLRRSRGAPRSAGQSSAVTTDFLHLSLDHDSGAIEGEVRAGRFAGRSLDSLSEADLRELLHEVGGDPDSVTLVEAYLDRRTPGWREDLHEDPGPRQDSTAAATGSLSEEEAYQILGLQPGAGEGEIRAAHRRLMKGLHPDRGGSTFLASKINEAKQRLLGGHN
ncbi:DnaJ domain-containing protein [Amorphus sp. MBR-141]